jgi:hypothetical protein
MLKTRVHKNTVLFSFENEKGSIDKVAHKLKEQLLNYLRFPYTNLMIDFRNFSAFNEEALDVLRAGQRLSEITHSQVTLFNVGHDALKLMRNENADHQFFFGDQPKPFSEEILLV